MKSISFIIVEYRSIDEIQSCVKSIDDNNPEPHEIIVSSNSCYNAEEKASLPNLGSNTRWLFNDRNGGFAYAMNEGMKKARGDYFVVMNSDCTLTTSLVPMITFMEANKGVGAIAPQLIDDYGNIQDSARPYVTPRRFAMRQLKRIIGHKVSILTRHFDYDKTQTVDWVIGAFIMVSRKAYELTGGMDDNMFMYAEDAEWCTHIRKCGLEVVYFPHVKVVYKGTRRARGNKKYARIFIQSHMYYWHKYGFFFGYPDRKRRVWD